MSGGDEVWPPSRPELEALGRAVRRKFDAENEKAAALVTAKRTGSPYDLDAYRAACRRFSAASFELQQLQDWHKP